MQVAYASPLPGFLPAEEAPHPDPGFSGQVTLRKPNGRYLCITPQGQVEERDYSGGGSPGGWEAFEPRGTYYLARREGNIYVLPRAA